VGQQDAAEPVRTDTLIVGAGPVGLFQVFELGLLEIRAQVVDSLPFVGGQCVELYADKPIYDIPGVPLCTGRGLVEQLQQQIAPFATPFHLGQVVSEIRRRPEHGFDVRTSAGLHFIASTIVIAGGVGAFQPRGLKLPGIEKFNGRQLVHRLPDEAQRAGKRLVIVGGDEAAVDAALAAVRMGAADPPAAVVLLHRRRELAAPAEKLAELQAVSAAGRLRFVVGQPVGFGEGRGSLEAIEIAAADGSTQRLPVDLLVVMLGLSPKLGPIGDWGLAMDRKQLVVDTEKFETSEPGIFAVGDINTYPGKKKLILCGFHEATLAAFGVARHVFPDRALPLQYTTTSPRLHELLGVAPGAGA
jgi:thioredoxin reductase (NADPH)